MADWRDKDPFAEDNGDWRDKDPFAGETPNPVAPVIGKVPMSAPEMVATGVAQVPKLLYEAGKSTIDAFGQAWGMAQAPFDVAAGLITGQGLQKSMERGGQRIKDYEHWSAPLPQTLGEPSWPNQLVSRGMNALVQRGVISQEGAESVGRLLAVAGVPKMLNSLRAPVQAGIENARARISTSFKSPAVRAGELWEQTKGTLPRELPQGQAERAATAQGLVDQRGFQRNLGVERLPAQQSPYIGRQQLAAQRAGESRNVYASEKMLKKAAQGQAEVGVERVLPRANVDQPALNFVNSKLQSVGKDAVTARLEAETMAAMDKFGEIVPKTDRPIPEIAGRQILERVRGEGREGGKVNTGIRAVQEVFNKEYEKFDAAGAVAPSKDLQSALDASASTSVEAGQLLSNYVDVKGKVAGKLGQQLPEIPTFAEEAAMKAAGQTPGSVVLPENLTLKQYRGLKGEFAAARDAAQRSEKYTAAREYQKLMKAAQAGEDAAAETLGADLAGQYSGVRSAYKNVYVKAYRKGHGGALASFGDEVGDFKIAPADVQKSLMDTQNARDFALTMGAEEAAKTGKTMTGLTENDLVALGRKGAQEKVRPYIESELAEQYRVGGVEAVTKYLDKNQDALRTYGLDFNELRTAATKYNEAMGRISGMKIQVAQGVVDGVMGQTNAAKLGAYVFDAATPANSYKNILRISKDPAWKPVVDTLITDEFRARMRTGVDVFADPKSRSLMEAMYTPEQMKVLQSYNKLWKRFDERAAKYGGEKLPEHPLEGALKMGQAYPPGFGWVYVAKNVAKRLVGKKIVDDTAAAWSYIDDAHLTPEKAAVIESALKGHRAAIEKLRAGVKAEESALKQLAWKGIKGGAKQVPPVLPGAIGGAVSAAGQKGVQDAAKEGE